MVSVQPINLNDTFTSGMQELQKVGSKRFSNLINETKIQGTQFIETIKSPNYLS